MKPSDVATALTCCIDAKQPVIIWGAPGIGKSQVAQQTSAVLLRSLIDVRASLLDPVDLRGIPSVKDGRTRWNPPSFLPDAAAGPISQAVLDCFAAELTAILHEARPERVEVLYCDYEIQHTEEFSPDDEAIKLAAHGGGGTRFNPVFERLNAADEKPVALIYFTDLENGRENVQEPDYPVLWCTGLNVVRSAPFGRTVRVDLFS